MEMEVVMKAPWPEGIDFSESFSLLTWNSMSFEFQLSLALVSGRCCALYIPRQA